jgi:hypothetical protein
MNRTLANETETPCGALGLLAKADRFMEQWGDDSEMEYAQSLVQLGPQKQAAHNHGSNESSYSPTAVPLLN